MIAGIVFATILEKQRGDDIDAAAERRLIILIHNWEDSIKVHK